MGIKVVVCRDRVVVCRNRRWSDVVVSRDDLYYTMDTNGL